MKILCILAHPNKDSYCGSLHEQYVLGAKSSGHEVRELILGDLNFDLSLHNGYKMKQELEPDLVKAQEDIKWAEHIVFTYPLWWGMIPAVLKGFIDRVFLPGYAFKYKDGILPEKLLKGRTARLIVTADSPKIIQKLLLMNAGVRVMKQSILWFVGINSKDTIIGPVRNMKESDLKKSLLKVYTMGQRGN